MYFFSLILSKIAREIQKVSNTSEEHAMTYYSDDELHRKPQRNKRIMHLYVEKSIIISCVSAITWYLREGLSGMCVGC